MSDEEFVEPQVDYGNVSGYWVRLDVEIPVGQPYHGSRDDGGPMGYLALSPDEADRLARRLVERAKQVRDLAP